MAELLATSPFVNPGDGVQPRRIVLSLIRDSRGCPVEYVIQRQMVRDDGHVSLVDGNWFLLTREEREAEDPLRVRIPLTIWARFLQRAGEEIAKYPLANLDLPRFDDVRDSLTVETGKG